MQVNSKRSINAGRVLHEAFGSWSEVRKASQKRDGVYVLSADALDTAQARRQSGNPAKK